MGTDNDTSDSEPGSRDSDRDLDDPLLREIAHAPPRQPRAVVEAGARWGPAGRFVIEKRLGRGGMGTVYAATDTVLGRVIALKVLDEVGAGQDPALQARLLREAQLGARMEHERIARVYDVGTHEGRTFVAMEHVPGGTLRQWMSEREVPVPQIVDIATQIAEGLAELHAKGVIHRDLKPENVMLTAQGGVKLLDFGLARNAIAPADEPGGLDRPAVVDGTSVATASGTPGYMAPEQCAGKAIDARVDIFSLGVIIHELVTGERLFRGATIGAVMTATLEDTPTLREVAWSRAPDRLREHTARMLAREPEARFADGGRVLAALRELTSEMPRHRSLIPAATAQALSKAPTQRALPFRVSRSLQSRAARHVVRACAAAGLALLIYTGWARLRHAEVAAPPLGMARIDVGTVELGRNADEIERECRELGAACGRKQMNREIPRITVTLPAFFLDQTEVTTSEFVAMLNSVANYLVVQDDADEHYPRWVAFQRGTGEPERLIDLAKSYRGIAYDATQRPPYRVQPGQAHMPVSRVTWYGARLFCETRGKRLPSENEWEAAARGRDDRRFPWGNELPRCGDVVIKNDGKIPKSGRCSVGDPVEVQPVGRAGQDVTRDGVRDLGGNVTEWTSSLFVPGSRASAADSGPRDAPRVLRGGSWGDSPMVRTSGRFYSPPFSAGQNIGFRCASTPDSH